MLLAGPLIVLVFRTLPQTFKAEIKNVYLHSNNHTFIKIVFLTKSPKVIGVEGCPGEHHQECTVLLLILSISILLVPRWFSTVTLAAVS